MSIYVVSFYCIDFIGAILDVQVNMSKADYLGPGGLYHSLYTSDV